MLGHTEHALLLGAEAELSVGIRAVHLPYRIDLAPENAELLAADVEHHVRDLFLASYESVKHPLTGEDVPPRTKDPAWSPVVEVERVALPEAALWLLFRTRYVPTNETLEGRLIIPAEDGLVCIAFLASESMTGYREATLMLEHDKEFPEQAGSIPAQRYFDARKHDAAFPMHGLSRIRAARAWLQAKDGGGLATTAAAVEAAAGEVLLPEAGCAVVPPARFVRLPAGTMPMSRTLAMFTRVVLGIESPRMLSVWLVPDEQISGASGLAELERIAVAANQAWTNEGATDIETGTERVAEQWGQGIRAHVAFKVGGEATQEVQCWFADTDGQVFRISSSAPVSFMPDRLWEEVRQTRASWRRLLPVRTPPWWKFWG